MLVHINESNLNPVYTVDISNKSSPQGCIFEFKGPVSNGLVYSVVAEAQGPVLNMMALQMGHDNIIAYSKTHCMTFENIDRRAHV